MLTVLMWGWFIFIGGLVVAATCEQLYLLYRYFTSAERPFVERPPSRE